MMKRALLSLIAVAFLSITVSPATALGPIIIDVDGSVESMAALATLVTHTASAGNIAMVTVTGTGWGTLTVAEHNVRAFLKLAGRENIPVAIGTSSTMFDAPDPNAVASNNQAAGGSCDDSRLFPPTPAMAQARGLNRSRYDEDDLYGAADALPLPANYGTKSKESTTEMSTFFNQLSNDVRVTYIVTASLTNLARFLKNGNGNAISTMKTRTDIHIYENGNNLCIDATATKLVIAVEGISIYLYAPSMLSPVKFTLTSWNSLKLSFKSNGVKAHVAWLFKALEGRKNAVDGGLDANAQLYFQKDGSLSAAFVVMAIVDSATATAGSSLLTPSASNKKKILYSATAIPSTAVPSLLLNGNNVTRGAYLILAPNPSGSIIVITASPSDLTSGQSVSMLDTFWIQWRNTMLG